MNLTKCFKLHYWPGLTCAWVVLTFIITYFMSTLYGHVYPYFPFISDTGATPPESCIFGQMMNIASVLVGIVAYVRYRQIEFAINSGDIDLRKRWNYFTGISAIIATLGVSIIGNFQETNVLVLHLLGCFMIFGNGTLYLLAQTRITYAFTRLNNKYATYNIGPKLLYIRIIITLCFMFLISTLSICALIALLQFTGKTIIWWTTEHGGYDLHLAAAIAEWLMVAVFLMYLLTFTKDFKSLEYEEIRFRNKCECVAANPDVHDRKNIFGYTDKPV